MSQDNVDLLRGIVDAWNQGDYEAATARVAGDVTADCALGGDFDGRYEGLPAVQRWLARFWGSFVEFRTEIGEVFEVEDEVVFEARHVGRGKASGAEVEMLNWQVITV